MRTPVKQEIKRYTTKNGELSVVFNPHRLPLPPKIAKREVVITDPKGEELFWKAIREREAREDRDTGHETSYNFNEGDRHHTVIHKAPIDWGGIAKFLEMGVAAAIAVVLLGGIAWGVSTLHGAGGGGGIPPTFTSGDGADGSLGIPCWKGKFHSRESI